MVYKFVFFKSEALTVYIVNIHKKLLVHVKLPSTWFLFPSNKIFFLSPWSLIYLNGMMLATSMITMLTLLRDIRAETFTEVLLLMPYLLVKAFIIKNVLILIHTRPTLQ